jgi:8-oxo-dGTP diphosphatase
MPSKEYDQPIVTVDVVLLTLNKEGRLHTALTLRDKEPFKDRWALPGGWVHTNEDEDAQDAAMRILLEKTGLKTPYLEQLQTFTGRNRDPDRGWSVSIAHYALVPLESVAQVQNDHLRWVPVDEIRSLPFDHLTILNTAVSRVRSKTLYSSLPVHLMPETFTLTELQRVYENLLGADLDKRGFRRRIEELGVVEEVAGAVSSGAHRPAQLFRVRRVAAKGLKTADSNLGVKGD